MKVENWELSKVIPYENNPRENDEAAEYVANSIKEFGFQQPIVVDKNGIIIAGHTRWKAAQQLGLSEVPVVVADELSQNQIDAYRLADNKVSEYSDWDIEKLNFELENIDWLDVDMTQFGFYLEDARNILDEFEEDAAVEEEIDGDIPFTDYIDEEKQYVVLKFDNEKDWLHAQSVLGLEKVQSLPTRKDGVQNNDFRFTGIGRVLDGNTAFKRIVENDRMLG